MIIDKQKKIQFKKKKFNWNIENVVMIIIKHLEINQVLALNNS